VYTAPMPVNQSKNQLFRHLPLMAVMMDPEGRIIDVSDEWVRRMGYPREEITGLSPVDISTPDSARRIIQQHLPAFRRTGRLDHVPVEFVTRDGRTLELWATTVADFSEQSDYRYSLSVFIELSDQARLERKFRDLYQSTPAMLHTIDAEGCITDVSDHWLEKLGYTKAEVIGRSILDYMTEESRRLLLGGKLEEILAGDDRKNVPRQMVAKNGEVMDVVMSTRSEPDGLTSRRKVLVASKDVTERNRAEAELVAAYGEIERLKEELECERDYLREEVSISMNFGRIVGESPALTAMLARIQAVAVTPASVLIVGETGTGKELVAHAIHTQSTRSDGPLVKVNCASIPDELFESEFFGHVKGAFTGAHRDRVGRFQLAEGGTIFLDEVGEIPLGLQGKLLRVLQEKEFEQVGEDRSRTVDVRVIAATNKDLEKAVEAGEFREDLYYRLGVFPVEVPPLRKRGDDVIMLAIFFLEQVCREFGREGLSLTQAQVEALRRYQWPGNVRELKNVIERAVILSHGETLRLDLSMLDVGVMPSLSDETGAAEPDLAGFLTEEEMKVRQKANLEAALASAHWRISGNGGAAELLGIKPSTLTDRMRSMGIRRPDSQ
jgi:PAS domain S-box-containing protein